MVGSHRMMRSWCQKTYRIARVDKQTDRFEEELRNGFSLNLIDQQEDLVDLLSGYTPHSASEKYTD